MLIVFCATTMPLNVIQLQKIHGWRKHQQFSVVRMETFIRLATIFYPLKRQNIHVDGKSFLFQTTALSLIQLTSVLSSIFNCLHLSLSFTARICLFYLIFYAALASFFVIYFILFQTTLKDNRPKYELEESIIGTNPGLGFRPMPPESNVESTLVWYEKNNPKNSEYWVSEIESFLGGKRI